MTGDKERPMPRSAAEIIEQAAREHAKTLEDNPPPLPPPEPEPPPANNEA